MAQVTIIDSGGANIASLRFALQRLGCEHGARKRAQRASVGHGYGQRCALHTCHRRLDQGVLGAEQGGQSVLHRLIVNTPFDLRENPGSGAGSII